MDNETEYIDVTPTEESEEETDSPSFPWQALMASAVVGATSTVVVQKLFKRRKAKKAAAAAEPEVIVITNATPAQTPPA